MQYKFTHLVYNVYCKYKTCFVLPPLFQDNEYRWQINHQPTFFVIGYPISTFYVDFFYWWWRHLLSNHRWVPLCNNHDNEWCIIKNILHGYTCSVEYNSTIIVAKAVRLLIPALTITVVTYSSVWSYLPSYCKYVERKSLTKLSGIIHVVRLKNYEFTVVLHQFIPRKLKSNIIKAGFFVEEMIEVFWVF